MTISRREVLRRAGLGAAGLATYGLIGSRAEAESTPFLHGVASGDPLHDRVVLWTRVTPPDPGLTAATVLVVVAPTQDLTDPVFTASLTADAAHDFTVSVDAGNLLPGRTYWYAFEAFGLRSPLGRTRTLPAPGEHVERVRVGVTSCGAYTAGYFNGYGRLAEHDLDFVVHLGDYIYEFGTGGGPQVPGREHEPAGEIYTVGDYRTRYAQYRTDPDLQRLHQQHPIIAVWDDHEFANDAYAGGADEHDPPDEGGVDWATRVANALQAYREWMPVRWPDPASSRIYRSFPVGDLADLVMLDTRMDGRDKPVFALAGSGPGADPEADDPDRQLYSLTQRDWLFGQLAGSKQRAARWRLLGNQVVLSPVRSGGIPETAGQPLSDLGILAKGGVFISGDAWNGYAAERDRLFNHLRSNGIDNVVVMTGDIHTAYAIEVTPDPQDPRSTPVAVEFVTPSITSENFDEFTRIPAGTVSTPAGAVHRATNPGMKFSDSERHGYYVLDITHDAVQADFWFVTDKKVRTSGQVFGSGWRSAPGSNRLDPAPGPTFARPEAPPDAPPDGSAATPARAGIPVALRPGAAGAAAAVAVVAKVVERRSRRASEEQAKNKVR